MSEPRRPVPTAAGGDASADAKRGSLNPRGRAPLARWVQAWWPTASVLVFGVIGGGLHAAALIFWVAPEGHWMRDSWLSVGLGFMGVWTLMWIGITRFMLWINARQAGNS